MNKRLDTLNSDASASRPIFACFAAADARLRAKMKQNMRHVRAMSSRAPITPPTMGAMEMLAGRAIAAPPSTSLRKVGVTAGVGEGDIDDDGEEGSVSVDTEEKEARAVDEGVSVDDFESDEATSMLIEGLASRVSDTHAVDEGLEPGDEVLVGELV